MPPKPNHANNQAHRGSSSIRFHPRERRFAEFGREGGEFDRSTEVHSSSPVRPFVRSFIRGRRPSIHPISHSLEPPIEIEAFACHVRARVGCSRIKNTRHGRRIKIDHGSKSTVDHRTMQPHHTSTQHMGARNQPYGARRNLGERERRGEKAYQHAGSSIRKEAGTERRK